MLNTKSLIMVNKKRSPATEAYRMIRTSLLYSKNGQLPQVIIVTSTRTSEGKTTTASNLALAFAQTGRKVLLLDGDVRKPSIHQLFGISKLKGLTSLLKNTSTITESVFHIDDYNIDIMPSGPSMSDPTELLSSSILSEIFNELKEMYQVILIDTPPVGVVTDAAMLAPIADGYVIVVSEGGATVAEFKNAKDHLEKVGADILGVIFNKMGAVLGKDSYYYKYYYNRYYYYGYGSVYGSKNKKKKGLFKDKKTTPNEETKNSELNKETTKTENK